MISPARTLFCAVGLLVAVTAAAPTVTAAAVPDTAPSASISVEWMNTSGNPTSSVPWMLDLTVELTSSSGEDFGNRCQHVVWADQQPSFLGIRFDCFEIPDGEYAVRLVGVPDDESAIAPCTSIQVPPSPDAGSGLGCLTSFFSAGVTSDYPPIDDRRVPDATDEPASPDVDGELPVTGRPIGWLLLVAASACLAGIVLVGARHRRPDGLDA